MWQTPVSNVSPLNSTPLVSSSARAAPTSSTWSRAMLFACGWNSIPSRPGSQIEKHVSPIQNSFHERSSGRKPSVYT
jgi:hypothetical protein